MVRSAAVIGAVVAMKIPEDDLGAEENTGEEISKQRLSCYLASYGTTEKDSDKEEWDAGAEEGGGEPGAGIATEGGVTAAAPQWSSQ